MNLPMMTSDVKGVLATCSSPVGEQPCEVGGLQFPWASTSH